MGVVYKITSPTGKVYVGKTYNLKARIADYKHRSKKRHKKIIILNSINKYGWDAHKLEILEELPNEKLNEREIFWISELNTYYLNNREGMNMTMGGEGQRSSWMHDIERRKYMSETFRGERAGFYGKTQTKEWREKKSKEVSEHNKKVGRRVPQWGAEKGWEKRKKSVVCYGSDGFFIREYSSSSHAAKELNINRSSVADSLKFTQWVSGQYLFKYKTDNYPLKIEVGEIKVKAEKRPVLFLNEDFEVMAEYESAMEASVELEVPKTSINRAALNNWLWPIRTGHIFIYKDLYEALPDWMKN